MSNDILIYKAIRLPAPDIEALVQGQVIVAMSNKFINRGELALCPTDSLMNLLPVERYYNSSFLPIAQTAINQLNAETSSIKAWAKCEWCQDINAESIAALSRFTIWTTEALQETLTLRENVFLASLRVYLLPEAISIAFKGNNQFVALPQPTTVSDANPVLSDRIFTQRQHQLEKLEPPTHPELEELLGAFASVTNPAAKQLETDIKVFLGWSSEQFVKQTDSDLAWINDIAKLGDRSKKEDQGKSNYQAGTDFEKVVRDSLEFLGFTLDYSHKGGAGGLDLFCSQPYPLFGECKAGKKIPNDTAVQLLNLGTLRRQDLFKEATKLIIGPGEPTKQLQDAAKVHGMAIINPKTLENLVKLQSTYRNSVDLFKLKKCLKAGQSDEEVEKYIQQVNIEIQKRSHIIKAVKELGESERGHETVEIRVQYNAVFAKEQKLKLKDEAAHDLLMELSSPLTGYLGRTEEENKSDRFYFLRDLPIN